MSEDELVRALAALFRTPLRDDVTLGIGDDAAVLAPSDAAQVLSVDAAIEGVHFERSFASLDVLGRRAAMAALSDLAAMGATPRAMLVSLALPRGEAELSLELSRGIAACATEVGCAVIGGNLTRADRIGVHTTVIGAMAERPITRSGACVGDGVWVSGVLGAAALGLAALRDGRQVPALGPFVERWRSPSARIALGRALVGRATACMDVSDGLLMDADRLARASGIAIDIELEALPRAPAHDDVARSLGVDGVEAMLAGGEDYELLFTLPDGETIEGATRIGAVRAGEGVRCPGARGSRGHDHFG